MMLVVRFADPASLARWREVELKSPAILSGRGLAEVETVTTTPVSLARRSPPVEKSPTSVFLVIPYKVTAPAADYLNYFDGYVIPQLAGWREEKILVGYDLFVAQFPAGRTWSSMLLLQYTDENALAQREETIARIRSRLENNSAWKSFADTKASFRTEQQSVVAEELGTSKK
jgi:hypothetical protein